jgi:hypothetical protein
MGIQQVSWEQMKKTYACDLVQLTFMLANSWSSSRIFGKMEDSLVLNLRNNFKT